MQNKFDTSFIPQQPLLRVDGLDHRQQPVNSALVLSFVLFFTAITIAGGVYLYGRQVDVRIQEKSAQLASLEENLDGGEVNLYKRIDSRIAVGKILLNDHRIFSVILDFLEQETATNIGLTNLNYRVNPDGEIVLGLRGVGPSYQSVYFQSGLWANAAPFVQKADMKRVSLGDSSGIVEFEADIVLNPVFLKYTKALEVEKSTLRTEENSPPTP